MKRPQNVNVRVRYTIIGLTLGLGGISALAATLTSFSAGDPISASSINANFSALNTSKLEIGQTLTGITKTLTTGGTGTMTAQLAEDGDFTLKTVHSDGNSDFVANQIKLDSSGSLYAKGSVGYGLLPATGAGERFMWYPSKVATRAGGVTAAQWDEGSIGYYSTAFGYNTTASSAGSFAAGSSTTASGQYATALGSSTVASSQGAFAVGSNTVASGSGSLAGLRSCT